MASESSGFGLRQGCFDTWMQKKDVTARYSIMEMSCAYGNGLTAAGEVNARRCLAAVATQGPENNATTDTCPSRLLTVMGRKAGAISSSRNERSANQLTETIRPERLVTAATKAAVCKIFLT